MSIYKLMAVSSKAVDNCESSNAIPQEIAVILGRESPLNYSVLIRVDRVRVALGLSAITRIPVHLTSVRENRVGSGGLKRQHLVSAAWLGNMCRAQVEGLEHGSKELKFKPGGRDGSVRFPINLIDVQVLPANDFDFQSSLQLLSDCISAGSRSTMDLLFVR